MRIRTDDRVWRFQSRLIELDGIEIPYRPRYVALGFFGLIFPLLLIVFQQIFDGVVAIGGAVMFAAILAWRAADFVTSEVPIGAWVMLILWAVKTRYRSWLDRDRVIVRSVGGEWNGEAAQLRT